jgi:hypothetical protein
MNKIILGLYQYNSVYSYFIFIDSMDLVGPWYLVDSQTSK